MKVTKTGMEGLLLIEPRAFRDERGFFLESFQKQRYADAGIIDDFIQDNHSHSVMNVLRGMHFQVLRPQAQFVSIIRGAIYDVAVDLRPNSPTFGKWYGVTLSASEPRQLYMAPGFAHGFCALSDFADITYKVSRYYDGPDEGGFLWNDPDIDIRWPIEHPLLSPRDATYPVLRDIPAHELPHQPPVER